MDTDKMVRDLEKGISQVQKVLESANLTGAGYDRITRLIEASSQIRWVRDAGTQSMVNDDEIQVVVRASQPLDTSETFRTSEDPDGVTRIYVQSRPYTQLWGAVVLFHELDHVVDHLDGIWPEKPTHSDWFAAEARAYHREALVLDAIAGGRLLPELEQVASLGTAALRERGVDDLANEIFWNAFPPRMRPTSRSEYERAGRTAALGFAAIVTAHAAPQSLRELVESTAGPEVEAAAESWGYLQS